MAKITERYAFRLIRFSMLEDRAQMDSIAPSPWRNLLQLLVNAPFCMFMKKLRSEANETYLLVAMFLNRSQ